MIERQQVNLKKIKLLLSKVKVVVLRRGGCYDVKDDEYVMWYVLGGSFSGFISLFYAVN